MNINKKDFLRKMGWMALMLNQAVFASKALYPMTLIGSPTRELPSHFKISADYTVTNQTKQAQTLIFKNTQAMTQMLQAGSCTSPFTLASNASCTLNLLVDVDVLTEAGGSISSPTVCNAYSDFFCSTPDYANRIISQFVTSQYILIANSGSGGFLSYCTIGTGGALENCNSATDASISAASGVAYTRSGYVYTANSDRNSISICTPGTDPGNMTCAEYSGAGGTTTFNDPRTAYIYNNYFYTMNYGGSTVTKCSIDDQSGALSDCVHTPTTGSGFSGPLGSMVISNGYAYIPNSSNSTISICAVSSSDGTFSDNCSTFSNSAFASPSGVAISGSYAYIISVWNNGVVACEVNSTNGTLSNCINNYVLTASTPSGLNIIDGYMYVNANQPDLVVKCTLGNNGTVSDCGSTGSGFDRPGGNIAFVTSPR